MKSNYDFQFAYMWHDLRADGPTAAEMEQKRMKAIAIESKAIVNYD